MSDKKNCKVRRFSAASGTVTLMDFPVGSPSKILLTSLWVLVIFLSVNPQVNKHISVGYEVISVGFPSMKY
jgi:hypothetical protein